MAANKQFFLILAIVTIMLPSIASATDYTVGDDSGWNNNFDYAAWAKDKQFYVGDTLLFKYEAGSHNVLKVNGTGFNECIKPDPSLALATGNDVITLATPGRKWYICGIKQHCTQGQKLFITVQDGAAPQPSPSSSANGILASGYQMVLIAMVAIGAMFAV
ncbi:mavicyanin-like [Papaver somniferum]|uniref:mavicyanin-like n=1 Tax=Papaver somniferum TaxID=3469 RepID=UPI000E6FC258|nr:mavicyanin-like [Papaver somniferum]